jgi:hypothetical protein
LVAVEYGEWQPWLAKNFDLSYRTAVNYCNAADYVARMSECATVAGFADLRTNLSPTILYALADGRYTPEEETEILKHAKSNRIDQSRATQICNELTAPPPGEPHPSSLSAITAEVERILDGLPPDVQPPPPIAAPTDYALINFKDAVSTLKQLATKPAAQFRKTPHSDHDLEKVERFISAVRGENGKRK